MTGFGRAAFELGAVAYAVEIRSVNHRYLDIKTRLPRAMAPSEAALRAVVGRRLARGRVEVVIQSVNGDAGPAGELHVDLHLAEALKAAHASLAEALGVPLVLDSAIVAAWPGVLTSSAPVLADAEVQACACAAAEVALTHLVGMREHEGAALAGVLEGHLDVVAQLRTRLEDRAPQQARAYRARLEARMRELLTTLDIEVDEGRVLHEIAVFAERTDVAEELARLQAHLEQARTLLASPPADGVGRRLDFLCQEMFREANTVASKVDEVELSGVTIELKAQLERLREQVQNVE